MGSLEGEEFYYKLSRKELQELCKKHGLPANKTNSQLANLLASYCQKKNVSLVPLTERSNGPVTILPHTSIVSNSKAAGGKDEAIRLSDFKRLHKRGVETAFVNTCGHSCTKDVDKEQPPYKNDKELVSGATTNRVPATFPIKDMEKGFGFKIHENKDCVLPSSQCDYSLLKFPHKEPLNSYEAVGTVQKLANPSRDVGHEISPQSQCGNKDTSKSLVEKGFETSTDVPSFQFYVRSEEGINLFVDLNSSPQDWIKKLKNEVCIYPEVQNKSWTLQHEVRNLGDGDAQIKASLLGNTVEDCQIRSDSVFGNSVDNSIMKESDHVEVDHSDRNGSLVSQLCKTESHMQNPKDASTERSPNRSDRVNTSHEFHDISQNKTTVCSVVNSKPDGPKGQRLSEPYSKSGNMHLENTETVSIGTSSISQQTTIPPSHEIGAAFLPSTRIAENSSVIGLGFSTSSSMDMQLSEVASHYEDTPNFPGLNGRPHSNETIQKLQTGYAGSLNCGFDPSTSADPTLANPDEQGGNDAINGTGSSECSQINDFSMRTSERSHSSEDDGRQSKRQRRNPDDLISNPVSTTKNIGSGKDMAREGLPRRSMRLVSK